MPYTYWTFFAGWLAICGIIPFSGFWSKDEILWNAASGTHIPFGWIVWLIGTIAATCTAFYMSLLYGVAGSTNVGDIGRAVGELMPRITGEIARAKETKDVADAIVGLRPLMMLGMIALAAGLFFKIAAVPFHMWAPDVYEGAPTSVTAFLSTGSKAASFVLYLRIFDVALGGMRADWAPLLGLVAAITIMHRL